MHPSSVVIHCDPILLDDVKEFGYNWSYSKQFGHDEIDVIVDDIPYECLNGNCQDPDVELCEHYGLNYDQVNCIEAMY